MSVARLVFAPRQHEWVPDNIEQVLDVFRRLRLIGDPLPRQGYYSAGSAFLDYLTFLGCAPTVEFEPESDDSIGTGAFYHFQISLPLDHGILRSDGFSYTPRCPGCKAPISSWRDWWSGGRTVEKACPECQQELSPEKLNWRRRAGCGRFFIDVLGIHAETVKPAPGLLDELEKATGTSWLYFFVED